MDVAKIREDFDAIARLSGADVDRTDDFDSFVSSLVPSGATSVLDVGCGGGALARRLAVPGRRIVALDLSPEMIARARRRVPDPSVTFHCGNFFEHDFAGEQFDCVVTLTTLHHMPTEAAVARLVSLVRPGGRLVIHDLRRDDGILDCLRSYTGLAHRAGRRLLKTGSPLPPKPLRDAWARHGAGETYPSFAEARATAERLLPGSRVFYHWLWRYTVVWDR